MNQNVNRAPLLAMGYTKIIATPFQELTFFTISKHVLIMLSKCTFSGVFEEN